MLLDRFQEPAARNELSTPRVLLWQARAAYVGPGMRLSPHRNAVATIALGLENAFEYTLFDTREPTRQRLRAVLIPPNTRHHLEADGAMAFLYLDALSDDLAALQRAQTNFAGRNAHLCELKAGLTAEALAAWLCTRVGLMRRPAKPNALTNVIRAIDDDPERFKSVNDAAHLAGLSSSRFQHVFREAVGVPFRRYRLWRRMSVVARALGRNTGLTDAAHEAGFSSSAHLSSTFRTMFGITPSSLLSARAKIECI
jgi:AraC-like DNA-binding protein